MTKISQENTAIERIGLITPLLDPSLDPAKKVVLRKALSGQSGLSERTLRRYEAAYQTSGFTGLKPKPKAPTRENSLPKALIDEAILLRREVPTRSVAQIIKILEWEGKAALGQIKRSTLQDHLTRAGFSATTIKSYQTKGLAARRFQAKHRNDLWQSDIKYGPYLTIGPKGTFKQMYLVLFMDDATRYILHGAFYDSLEQVIVKDAFMEAIRLHGVPKAIYFDNGTQYRNQMITHACSKLDIRLLYAKPYSPEGTGKPERMNRNIDHFLQEIRIDKPTSLDELNTKLNAWLTVCYQDKAHSALPEQISPRQCYLTDKTPQRFIDSKVLCEAFKLSETRKVDKTGCISLKGKKFEVGTGVIGQRVTVVYDPSDLSEITIEADHLMPYQAKELIIGPKAGKRPELPERLTEVDPGYSRLLKACEKKQTEKVKDLRQVISYASLTKGGVNHV